MVWTDPNLVNWEVGDALTSADMKTYVRDNLLALKNPPTELYTGRPSYSTTSTAMVYIDATNLNKTIETTGGDVLIILQGGFFLNSLADYIFVDFEIDGSLESQSNDGLWYSMSSNGSYDRKMGTVLRLVQGLAAGSHTIKPKWRVTGGTGTLGNILRDVQFIVRELS